MASVIAAQTAAAIAAAQAAVSAAQTTLNAANRVVATKHTAVTNAQATVVRAQAALSAAKNQAQRTSATRNLTNAQSALTAAQAALVAAQTAATNAAAVLEGKKAVLAALTAPPPVPVPAPVVGCLKRALLVGINYVGTPYELAGCINDAKNMMTQLQTYFPACTEYRILTDETEVKPTRANVLEALGWLTAGLKPGENVVFHYSGHGGQVRDTSGDEVAGLDSCIYPCNGSTIETIVDDEIRSLLALKVPAGCKCLVILDSCHSGTAVDLRYTWQAPVMGTLSYTEDQRYIKTPGTVLFISGCRDDQTAADTVGKDDRPCGALTMALLETWKGYGAAIKLKYLLWDIRTFLKDNGYSQIPQLETGNFLNMNGVFDLSSAQ